MKFEQLLLIIFFSYAAYMAGMESGKTEERQKLPTYDKKLKNCLAVIRNGN